MNLRVVLITCLAFSFMMALPNEVSARNGHGKDPASPAAPMNAAKGLPSKAVKKKADKTKKNVEKTKKIPSEKVPDHAKAERAVKKSPVKKRGPVNNQARPAHKKVHPVKPEKKQVKQEKQPEPPKGKPEQNVDKVSTHQKNIHSKKEQSSSIIQSDHHKERVEYEEKRIEKQKPEVNKAVKKKADDPKPPKEPPLPQPLNNGIVLPYQTQKTSGKPGNDRTPSDGPISWVAANMTSVEAVPLLFQMTLLSRHYMLRNQWMNAPPGKPPKVSFNFKG